MDKNKAPTRRTEARQPGAGSSSMRRFALSSMGIHILVLSVVSLPVVQRESPVHAEPLYEVALIEWPEANFQPPTPTPKKSGRTFPYYFNLGVNFHQTFTRSRAKWTYESRQVRV